VEVAVRGLERVPASIVLDSIGVRVGELLSEERLRADVAAVVATGWFADATVRIEPLREGVRVVFLVVENPVVHEIRIEGNTKVSTADIVRVLNVPTGQVLNVTRLRDGARAVEKLYEERGFVLARIVDVGIAANGTTTLRLRIAEGRIEAVEYVGLTKTRRFVVERGRTVQPGGIFNINDLNKDLQRLVALDLFESVQARPKPGTAPESVILEIEVKEQRTQQARFGLGYGERTGIVGLVEYSEKNWRGRGQTLTLRAERGLSTERQVPLATDSAPTTFLLSFREPHLDARATSMETMLYQNVTSETEYLNNVLNARFSLERLGSSIAFTRLLDPQTAVTLRLRSERATIAALPLNPNSPYCRDNPNHPLCPRPLPSLYSPGRTIALSLSGVRDTRDSRTAATRGERIGVAVDLGLAILGGDFGYGRYSAEYARYLPGGSGTFVGRVQVGFSTGGLPFQEWFAVGGPSTLRAYPTGFQRGTSSAVLNVEYRLPLGPIIRQLREFTGIVFVDAGGAPLSTREIKVGYGVGLTFNTAVGSIRLDYAIGSEGTQTWLTIGNPF
jgi:outer membrane protein insertion porin family